MPEVLNVPRGKNNVTGARRKQWVQECQTVQKQLTSMHGIAEVKNVKKTLLRYFLKIKGLLIAALRAEGKLR